MTSLSLDHLGGFDGEGDVREVSESGLSEEFCERGDLKNTSPFTEEPSTIGDLKNPSNEEPSPTIILNNLTTSSLKSPTKPSLFLHELPSSTRYTLLCSGNTVYYCCCLYFYRCVELADQLNTLPVPLHHEHTSSHMEGQVFTPTCLVVLSQIPSPEAFCSLLPSLLAILTDGTEEAVSDLKAFLLRDALKPIPNLLSLQFTIHQSHHSLQSFALSQKQVNRLFLFANSFIAHCVKQLFDRIDVKTIVDLLLLLLLEEKILLVSNQLELLPILLEGLLVLLPYTWPHPFIPLIPYYLLPVLIDSPSPFLFGTSITTYSFVKDSIPADVNVIFLRDHSQCPSPLIPDVPRRWM